MDQLDETLAIFRAIYRENRWGYGASASGPGSTLRGSARIRATLPAVLRALDVSVMLDAPCGDLHWMRPADLPIERFIGMDVVPEVVEKAESASEGFGDFRVADIAADPLPTADLVFCRDCLVHLANDRALAALHNLQASGARFLMATTFYAVNENLPRATGDWRPLNLQLPPFSLPPPLLIVPDAPRRPPMPFFDKSMGVWELADLSAS